MRKTVDLPPMFAPVSIITYLLEHISIELDINLQPFILSNTGCIISLIFMLLLSVDRIGRLKIGLENETMESDIKQSNSDTIYIRFVHY